MSEHWTGQRWRIDAVSLLNDGLRFEAGQEFSSIHF
jgi:hypothetical protein